MGEYATYKGESVKIGTCENMYYLRFNQRHWIHPEPNSLNVLECLHDLRFRFPWPDEDNIQPGAFDPFERSIWIPRFTAPEGVEHSTIQFQAHAGYNVCLPCPESEHYTETTCGSLKLTNQDIHVFRNGHSGAVHLVQQKYLQDRRLVPVMRCGGCGAKWREEDPARIEELAMFLRAEADKRERRQENGDLYHKIADRVLAGVQVTY